MDAESLPRGALRLLSDVAILCNDGAGLYETLAATLKRVCEFNGWTAGLAYLAPESRPELLVLVARHISSDAPADTRRRLSMPPTVANGEGLIGAAHARADSLWTVAPLPASAPDESSPLHAVVVPVLVGPKAVGVLQFLCEREPVVPDDVREAIESIGMQVGLVVDGVRLHYAIARAANAERRRIGQNLHDSVCQTLAGLALTADHLHRSLADGGHAAAPRAESIADGARRALADVRSSLDGLLPLGLQQVGLADALNQLARSTETRYQIGCTADCTTDIVDEHAAFELFFVASEAVSNAARHARTDRIDITLAPTDSGVRLEIRDYGKGMKTERRSAGRFGLLVMKSRAIALGGTLKIDSTESSGTTVRCEVPRHAFEHEHDDRADHDPQSQGESQGMAIGAH